VMKNIHIFIDGFNVYHRIHDFYRKTGENLKWLDYHQLLTSLLKEDEQIGQIHFFTAVDKKRPVDVTQRHENYIGALKSSGIFVYRGIFKHKTVQCRQCHTQWVKAEEKETDVRIATKTLELASSQEVDSCWIISGDSDLVPLVQSFQVMFPQKEIKFLLPPVYNPKQNHTNAFAAKTYSKKCKIETVQLGYKQFREHQLPNDVKDTKQRIFSNPYLA
jgi:uncharacterized LabA/DUF88 family protein